MTTEQVTGAHARGKNTVRGKNGAPGGSRLQALTMMLVKVERWDVAGR